MATKHQKQPRFCSDGCRGRVFEAQKRQRARERIWAEMAHIRPDWMPRQGSGYREERIPWEGNEEEAVTREREAKPNRLPPGYLEEGERDPEYWAGVDKAEPSAEAEQAPAPPRNTKDYWYELLVDESRWWKL